VGQAYEVPWTLADWRAFHDERLAIRLYDGGMPQAQAARWAWLDCTAKWLERHPHLEGAQRTWTGTAEEFRFCRIQDAITVLERLCIVDTHMIEGELCSRRKAKPVGAYPL
jgi:hypothetical protein